MSGTRIGGLAAPSTDPVGRTMGGRFRIGRMLGAGGMGTVHEAVDVAMGRPVAIKLLRSELARDQHQLQRFEREARAAAQLSHPNVVGVTELVRDDTLGLGLVMERLVGESLATRLERGPLSETEAVSVMMQALDGMSRAHGAGMVHRDLKPSNVFLVPLAGATLVKILDFGIVKFAEEGAVPKLTRKGAMIGTPTYMSPEQVACAPIDARSDVYSMGACLYEALVARPPYEEPHSLAIIAAVGAGPPRDLHEIDRRVSPDLAHIVRVAMSRDPNGRYQTAEAMREALRSAVIDDGPPRAPLPRAPTEERGHPSRERTRIDTPLELVRRKPRHAPILAIAIVLTLALIALAWSFARPSTTTTAPPAIAVPTTIAIPRATTAPPTTIAAPAPPTTVAAPPTTIARPPPTTTALPHGVEPPPPPPPPTTRAPVTHPRPHGGRVGEDVLDPFASP